MSTPSSFLTLANTIKYNPLHLLSHLIIYSYMEILCYYVMETDHWIKTVEAIVVLRVKDNFQKKSRRGETVIYLLNKKN